jgi:hypothetical protein
MGGEEYGKGHEFPTATYRIAWDVNVTLERYLIGTWAVAFTLGKPRSAFNSQATHVLFERNGRLRESALWLESQAGKIPQFQSRPLPGRNIGNMSTDHRTLLRYSVHGGSPETHDQPVSK